jgi:hypothetical protein
MNRWRVGEEKEMDRCPLTIWLTLETMFTG